MPNEKPLLTIAIPTYNRSRYLGELLTALAPQLQGEQEIELIISDNASQDDTNDVVQGFIKAGLQARYIRNSRNIGSDSNFLQCFEQARGQYFWLFGDDDILLPGSIQRILPFLRANLYDLIYLSPYGFRQAAAPAFRPDPLGRREIIETEAKAFAKRVGTMFTLISCNIVNKAKLLGIAHQPFSKFLGTNFIQLSWTYTLLSHFSKGLYIYDTYVAVRDGTSGGYSISRVFGQSLTDITTELLGHDPEMVKNIHSSSIRGILPLAILQTRRRRHGNFEEEDFHSLLRPIYGMTRDYWLFVYPIARGPLWLASAWFFCMRKAVWMKTHAGTFFSTVCSL